MVRKLAETREAPINDEELFAIMEICSIIDRNRLTGVNAKVFNLLFPECLQARPFDMRTVQQNKATEYTRPEKKTEVACMEYLGFTSSKKKPYQGKEDVPSLNLAYTNAPQAFTTHLNNLPFMLGLKDTAQTDPMPHYREGIRIKMNRADHSKLLAYEISKDLMRMAIKTPELFIRRVWEDMRRYNQDPGFLVNKKKAAFVESYALVSPVQKEALALALEYAKYLTLFAYLHDERTPAWGDLTMVQKKARFAGQADIDFSEDVALYNDILLMIDDPSVGLDQIIAHFGMDRDFALKLIRSLAQESDSCLGGLLIKNKRKTPVFLQNAPPALHALADKAAFDKDQTSGTTANLQDMADQILPGGFHSLRKKGHGPIEPMHAVTPIGSFHNRLMLLSYALATGMSKSELAQRCREKGVDPYRLFIAAEEFQVGPNILLTEVPQYGGEIMPVALDPGALERLMLSFAALNYFYYSSDSRTGTERLIQDILTCIQFDYNQRGFGRSAMEFFFKRSDYEVDQTLEKYVPILPYIFEHLINRVTRVPREELDMYIAHAQEAGQRLLISPAQIPQVPTKSGTLTFNALGEIEPYLTTLDRDTIVEEGGNITYVDIPYSLPKLLDKATAYISTGEFYYVINLEPNHIATINELIKRTPALYKPPVLRALQCWMSETNPLPPEFLLQ